MPQPQTTRAPGWTVSLIGRRSPRAVLTLMLATRGWFGFVNGLGVSFRSSFSRHLTPLFARTGPPSLVSPNASVGGPFAAPARGDSRSAIERDGSNPPVLPIRVFLARAGASTEDKGQYQRFAINNNSCWLFGFRNISSLRSKLQAAHATFVNNSSLKWNTRQPRSHEFCFPSPG